MGADAANVPGLSNTVPIRTAHGLKFGDLPAELLQTMNCR